MLLGSDSQIQQSSFFRSLIHLLCQIFNPFVPRFQSLASAAGDFENFQVGVDAPRIFFDAVQVIFGENFLLDGYFFARADFSF
jgi:hypothetical protein